MKFELWPLVVNHHSLKYVVVLPKVDDSMWMNKIDNYNPDTGTGGILYIMFAPI